VVSLLTPAIFVAATISMSSNCSSVKSGAILSKIGFALAYSYFEVFAAVELMVPCPGRHAIGCILN
jgi:hypothetical protein